MTDRENALRIIRFDRPERIAGGPPTHGVHYLGCNHKGLEGGGHDSPVGTRWTDIWGTVWHKIQDGVMGFPVRHPFTDPESVKHYSWPDPNDERICGQIYTMAEEFPGGDKFLSGSHRETLLEKANALMGMDNIMTALRAEPDFARDVLHHIMGFQLGIAEHYAKVGVELAGLGDDLGTQVGPLIGPEMMEEFFVPEYERLFAFYKERGILIAFHSCGHLEPMLDMFMRLGVDVLNPVQATANDLDKVRAKTQGRMALQGAVSSALVVAGPPERIVAQARKRMWQLGRDGGYFCGPDQGMPWPQEHIDALHEAVETYGRYPLEPPPED